MTTRSGTRQLPKPSEIRELVRFRPVQWRATSRRLSHSLTIDDLRKFARRTTPRAVFDYVDGAADGEITVDRNSGAFQRATCFPEPLHDVSHPDLSSELLGRRIAMPLVFAPTGYTAMMHHLGEGAVARVAAQADIPYSLSTVGTTSIEDVRQMSPSGELWFQLYVTNDRALNAELVARAAAAGYGALLLTVDTSVAGSRLRDNRNGLTIPPTLSAKTFLDMSMHPNWWFNKLTLPTIEFANLRGLRERTSSHGVASTLFDPGLNLKTLDWLRSAWPGKLLVKGVLTVDAAREVIAHGADGVIISNHGGRQLDRTPPTLDALAPIREALGADPTILLDGGVRNGQDILIARALGADAVMVGRAYLYGLMAGGEPGVQTAYEILRSQYQRALQLMGLSRTEDLTRRHVQYTSLQ